MGCYVLGYQEYFGGLNFVEIGLDMGSTLLFQHATGHCSMGRLVYAKILIRFWDIQFLEEHIGHIGVKVLAGVDDCFCEV